MSTPHADGGRLRACGQFIAAILYFFLARSLARHGAEAFATDSLAPLVTQAIFVFLLLLGYAAMGSWFSRQQNPIQLQGFPRRPDWLSEIGMGLATGWGVAIVCVLPLTVFGGIAIVLSVQPSAWAWFLADAAFFALAALAEEIAFRGYAFQRFVAAAGPVSAQLGMAAFYAIVQAQLPGSNRTSVFVSVALSILLSTAYLRTRALWMSWGLNFAWKASRALLFGLAISGVNSHSSIIQGNPMGPFWLTGGGFGLDGSVIVCAVLLAALIPVYRLTRELDYRYNAPVIVPGGIPLDLSAAQQRQHEAATGTAQASAATGTLVQILPATLPPPPFPVFPPLPPPPPPASEN